MARSTNSKDSELLCAFVHGYPFKDRQKSCASPCSSATESRPTRTKRRNLTLKRREELPSGLLARLVRCCLSSLGLRSHRSPLHCYLHHVRTMLVNQRQYANHAPAVMLQVKQESVACFAAGCNAEPVPGTCFRRSSGGTRARARSAFRRSISRGSAHSSQSSISPSLCT